MTAGVIGANIGAGWVIISGGPILLMLLVWALAISVYLWSRAGHARKKPVSRPDTG